jgi:hypothetical protein
MLLRGSSSPPECVQKTTRQRKVAAGLTLCPIHKKPIVLVISLAISSPPIAFGRRSVLLYLNARNALRETAANLARIDDPKSQSGAREPPALRTQLLFSIVDCKVVQHDHAPGHCKMLEHRHLRIQEDHIPSKVHRVKHNQPLDRARRTGQ